MHSSLIALGTIVLLSASAFADPAPSSGCPSEKLCPEFIELTQKCEKDLKSESCEEFTELFRKLTPSYDCRRSFDTNPVPAIWLCDANVPDYPKPHEKGLALLAKLRSKKARKFFGSAELRSTLDGALAEEYLKKSRAAGKRTKP
jgi:hypothetical protein